MVQSYLMRPAYQLLKDKRNIEIKKRTKKKQSEKDVERGQGDGGGWGASVKNTRNPFYDGKMNF